MRRFAEKYRRSQLEGALSFALDNKQQQANKMAADLEELLPELDRSYKPGTVTLLIKGVSQFNDGDMLRARATMQEVLRLDPGNVMADSVYARSLLNTGDWPQFLEYVRQLELPSDADFHERVLFWHGQLDVNSQATKALEDLVAEYGESALARATYALSLAGQAVDLSDSDLATKAIDQAIKAHDQGPASSLVALALVNSHMAAIMLADEDRKAQLVEDAKPYVTVLEGYEGYTSGRLALAQFFSDIGQHEQTWRCPARLACRD